MERPWKSLGNQFKSQEEAVKSPAGNLTQVVEIRVERER